MIKNRIKKYLLSATNLTMFCGMMAVAAASLSHSISRREEIEQVVAQGPASDVSGIKEILNGYNGISYLFDFLFTPNFYTMFILVILLGIGITFGNVAFNNLQTGYGNNIVVRAGYKKYLINELFSQVATIIITVDVFIFVLSAFLIILWPIDNIENTETVIMLSGNEIIYLLVTGIHIVILNIYIALIVIITFTSNVCIRNKHIIQALPVFCYFIPFVLGSTIGNFGSITAKLFTPLISQNYVLWLYDYFVADPIDWSCLFILPGTLFMIATVLLFFNTKRLESDYL